MHKLLARQLRRKAAIASDAELTQALAVLSRAAGQQGLEPLAARLARALPALLGEIEAAYTQFDRDLELRRRSLAVSSEELLDLNNQLRADAASRQRALDTLREAANRLLIGAGLPALQEGEANLESLSSRMAQIAQEREAAQEKLRDSEARLVLALNVTESVAWDWDITNNKLVVISTGDEVLGYPRERIENDPPRIGELIDPAGRGQLRDKLVEHFRGETPAFKFGVWMTVKGRDRRYMQFHGKVVARDGNGRALRMAGIMHDLTANKLTEEALRLSEARFRSLTDLSSDWYWEQDEQFHFTGTQGESDARAGITADAHVGRARWELPHTYPVGFGWDEHRALLQRHEPFRDLVLKRAPPGEHERYVSVSGAPVFGEDGRLTGYRGVAKDVTERVRAEEALRESQSAAEEATRAKSQFLANMSHEIRTPMNGVLGMTELLLGTPLDAKQRQFAETARRSGQALLALINDILDFSKIEAGKMEIDRVEFVLRDVLEDVAQLLAESAAAKGLELVCRVHAHAPAVVTGDPNRLRQVLINLIGNAVKFTEKGEVVTEVHVTDDARTAKRVLCFEVRDTGIGIATDAQAGIFDAFSQADESTTRDYGGTGLGLAICRQLVSLMGGDLSLESEPGKGSTFRFTVPCQKAPAQAGTSALAPHAESLHGKRLLIVDDHAGAREAVQDIAEGIFGMRCAMAADAISALKLSRAALARGEPFAAAIVKADMPHIDGLALAEIFKLEPALAGIGLILASSLNRAGDAGRARAAGYAATITKPVRQADLLRALLLAFDTDPREVSQKMRTAAPSNEALRTRFSGRVLVAEDYPVNQEVIRAVLEACGCEVHMAKNGREAVQAMQQARFDLVFMDCQMPEMDGYMATRAIRALEQGEGGAGRRTPIVALTAHATAADRERCLNAGMDSYVSKPFTQAILRRELERWLSGASDGPAAPATEAPVLQTVRLDLRALNELRSLDPIGAKQMLQGLVDTYVEHTAALLERLRAAVDAGDFEAIEREAHRLKSGSLTIGAARVGKLAHRLEQQSLAKALTDGHSVLAEVEVEFAAARRLLQAEVYPAQAAA